MSDGQDTMYVLAGCKDCWANGFIERYQASTNTWTKLNTVPDINIFNKDEIHAEVCAYSNGFIYAIFFRENPTIGPRYLMDKRFHIYNTMIDSRSISDTQMKSEAYFTVSGVISN